MRTPGLVPLRVPKKPRKENSMTMKNSMTRENSKILITAAGGKVGQHVLTQLAEKKISARGGVHSQAKASALLETGIEAAVLDFESSESIAAAFKGTGAAKTVGIKL
jgi:NADPH:quinone reductase-like Zn-dependent oxidoreductase